MQPRIDRLANDYGITLVSAKAPWTPAALAVVETGVQDLVTALGGGDRFRKLWGGVRVELRAMRYGGWGSAHRIRLNANPAHWTAWSVVHELGHAWDGANGWWLSWQMRRCLGGRFPSWLRRWLRPEDPRGWYDPGMGPPPCGVDRYFDPLEDFAESVAAWVYPEEAARRAKRRGWPYSNPARGYDYPDFLSTPRGQYVAALVAAAGAPRGYLAFTTRLRPALRFRPS